MASPNISLLGANYPGVAGVTLPKQGGGTATFPWVEGSQTISANGTVDVTTLASVTVAVPDKNVQIDNANYRITGTTYVDTGATLTVAVTGTYDIYWQASRSSTQSGTNGTQLYNGSTAVGSAFEEWENNYAQTPHLSGVSLTKNDVLHIYARSSANGRYVCVGNLIIVQSA